MAVDPQFGVDVYNREKVLTESQTVVYNILTLLFGKPGFYPSIPQLGMNIQQYLYTFQDDFDTEVLKAELAKQCRDFSTNISDGSFDIIKSTYNEQPLLVFVIPTVITKENTELVLGVTITKQGDFKFNFIFNKQQYI